MLSLTHHRPRPGRVLVHARGEIDLSTATDLRRLLVAVVRDPDPATGRAADHVVCDLDGVTFLAAAGVGALAETAAEMHTRGGRLDVVATTRPARPVLELCATDPSFRFGSRSTGTPPDDRPTPAAVASRSAS